VRTKNISESNAFAVPFSSELWMLILLVIVSAGVTFWYLESDEGNHNEDIIGEHGRSARGLAENFVHTTYLSMITVTTFACHAPSTVGGKIFSFFYLLFCTLILTSYTANLTTIMVGLAMNDKVEEAKTFVRGGNTACIQSDTAYGKHLKDTYSKFGKFAALYISDVLIPKMHRLEICREKNERRNAGAPVRRDMQRDN
jgi:hypothetical protein